MDILNELAKHELCLIPIPVYASAEEWEDFDKEPIDIYWSALYITSNPSIYLPIDTYIKDWNDWISLVDESIKVYMLAETPEGAIEKAIERRKNG